MENEILRKAYDDCKSGHLRHMEAAFLLEVCNHTFDMEFSP